jgi:hypothetical protein
MVEAYLHMVRGHFLGSAYYASESRVRGLNGPQKHIQTAVRLCPVRVFALIRLLLDRDLEVQNKVEEQLKEREVVQADR